MATPPKKPYILTENQKSLILDNFGKGVTDVNLLTKLVTGNDKKDGRDIEGKAVRLFLAENGKRYKTKHNPVREDSPELSEENKKQIELWMAEDKTTLEMAKAIFGAETKKLSREWRAVFAYVQGINPDYSPEFGQRIENIGQYYVPKETDRIVKKINEATGLELNPLSLSGKYKQYVDKLRVTLNNLRFVTICNSYTNKRHRDLFEQQFILLTWDKLDLTPDELNLYMNVCKDIVTSESLSKHINSMNEFFESMEDAGELTQRFAETLKAKASEYQHCMQRISKVTADLQGDRAKRLESKSSGALSLIGLLEEFQEERSRRQIIELGRREKEARKKEGQRLESISELKARVLGFAIDDVI